MEFPDPVISLAIEPKTKADQEKWASRCSAWRRKIRHSVCILTKSLARRLFPVWANCTEIIVDRMKREFGVEANIGRPQVTYRETLRKAVKDIEGKFVRQSGGKGQYGHVVLSLEPLAAGSGFCFRRCHQRRCGSA